MKSSFVLISFVLMIFVVVTAADKSICLLFSETGPCRMAIPSYFYNFVTKECENFIYGGCLGNGNRFWTKEECEKMCKDEA